MTDQPMTLQPAAVPQSRVLKEIFREALLLSGFWRGRSLLALAGVAIGAAAVIAMLHVGHNARAAALRVFQALDWNLIIVTPEQTDDRAAAIPLTAVQGLVPAEIGVKRAAALVEGTGRLRAGRGMVSAGLVAATETIYAIGGISIAAGRATADLDRHAPFAVVGAETAADYAEATGHALSVGDRVTVNGQILTVIGLMAETPSSIMLSIDFNRSILVPFGAAPRLTPRRVIDLVAAELTDGADDREVAQAVKQFIAPHMPVGYPSVQTPRQLIESIGAQMRIYALLILGIGSVSLFVGGVGIMNVMLMNVMERQREIGLRQALGARRMHIRVMFLIEAVIHAALGSALGTALGYACAWVFAKGSDWIFEPSPWAPILGAGMAVTVGLVFGVLPAERAARLNPVTALRNE